eukprot:scaffold257366_cov45-Prasinocladus_malaysianus.AAC.2
MAVQLIAEVPKYVCRAGLKMEKALEHWNIDVSGKVALDAGIYYIRIPHSRCNKEAANIL